MTDETTRPDPDGGDDPTRALPDEVEEPTRRLADEQPPEPAAPDGPPGALPPEDRPASGDVWQPPHDEDAGGRHPLSVAHLVAGLVFLGIATSWLLRETGVVDSEGTGWFLPLTLVVAGAIGLLAWFSSARGKTR